jgi:hypothetical protein
MHKTTIYYTNTNKIMIQTLLLYTQTSDLYLCMVYIYIYNIALFLLVEKRMNHHNNKCQNYSTS